VLFVCMGNICRSPTAQAVLEQRLAQAGLSAAWGVDSAGTHGANHAGEAPDARAARHAAARGYSLAGQRARAVVAEDFVRFRHLVAMDAANLAWLQKSAPAGAGASILRLGDLAGFGDVPDPYYGPPAGFERALDLIEAGCDALLARLRSEAASAA
jgi:protein-tyrosine phosphatase